MDYKDKYMKYKTKYIYYKKNQFGGKNMTPYITFSDNILKNVDKNYLVINILNICNNNNIDVNKSVIMDMGSGL